MEKVFVPNNKNKINRLALYLKRLNSSSEVDFDLTHLRWAKPFGMLFTGMLIRQLIDENSNMTFKVTPPKSLECGSYIEHMGFYKFVSEKLNIGKNPGEATGSNNYVPITKINLADLRKSERERGNYKEMGLIIEEKSKALSKVLTQNNLELEELLTFCFREILRNIYEHSDSDNAWICAQYWPTKHIAEIAIVDEGIGIRESLCKNKVHSKNITDDEKALYYAIKPGISTSFNPSLKNKSDDIWSNSGYGLYMISQICQELGGVFNLVSGSKCMNIDKTGKMKILKTNYKGVAVGLELHVDNLTSTRNLMKEISRIGELEAKNIRNAFKEASIASKGPIS